MPMRTVFIMLAVPSVVPIAISVLVVLIVPTAAVCIFMSTMLALVSLIVRTIRTFVAPAYRELSLVHVLHLVRLR
jgi:hypothetical protein